MDVPSVYSMRVRALDGRSLDLRTLHGKVSLLVNVASHCGYTPQYEGLQQLHEALESRGFTVLGFPCDDFGGQEPGTAEEIGAYCSEHYSVEFPLAEKSHVLPGVGQSPVYAALKDITGMLPAWNFGKYLVGKDGRVLAYFGSGVTPEDPKLRRAIEVALEM
jgi:glutathione peroxidase